MCCHDKNLKESLAEKSGANRKKNIKNKETRFERHYFITFTSNETVMFKII